MPIGKTDRGFEDYANFKSTYGHEVTVRESSAAMAPHVWVFGEGEVHLRDDPRPFPGIPFGIANASMGLHLTVEQAKILRDGLDDFIERVEERWECVCDRLSEYGSCPIHGTAGA